MSFSRNLLTGAGFGLATGCVFSFYSWGSINNPQKKHVICLMSDECIDVTDLVKSIDFVSVVFSPPLFSIGGALCGAGYFGAKKGIKYIWHAPKPIQLTTAAIFATSIASAIAYERGKKN